MAARGASRGVVVVGAGLGGLSAAVHLAAAGVQVTVLERCARPGGRAGARWVDGFRFDTGPSVMTMPSLVGDLFALAGEDMDDHVPMDRLDPAYRAVFHDGSELFVRATLEDTAREVARVCGPEEADRLMHLAERLRRMYELELPAFIDANFDSPADLLRDPVALLRLARLGGFRRMAPLVAGHLSDWRLLRLFTFQALYAGMSPFQALGIYAVIPYMDTVMGVYFPRGGIHALPIALSGLAGRMGVQVRLSCAVDRVEVSGGRATAVVTGDGERIPADVVVLNPDLPVAYRDLLPPGARPRRLRHLRYSPSCVLVHLGLRRRLPTAAHHNIHFGEDYRGSFDDVLAGRMQRDASWFLSVPSRGDPSMAPPGGEVAFHLLPAPNLRGTAVDWRRQAPRELRLAQQRMQRAGYGAVEEATVVSETVTPPDWERQGMAAGTPFAVSHHLRQTGPFRPSNVAPKVGGVVFCGSSTTPGVGIPMVLISGKLAAQRVLALLAGPP